MVCWIIIPKPERDTPICITDLSELEVKPNYGFGVSLSWVWFWKSLNVKSLKSLSPLKRHKINIEKVETVQVPIDRWFE